MLDRFFGEPTIAGKEDEYWVVGAGGVRFFRFFAGVGLEDYWIWTRDSRGN